mgnify:CR=1 FL=1
MHLKDFLRDRAPSIAAAAFAAAFSFGLLRAVGGGLYAGCYLSSAILLAAAAALEFEYLKRRKFYRSVVRSLEKLDRKFLLAEVLERPSFAEGQLFCDALRESEKSMNDEVAAYRRESQEYREYIETWVHEIKTPISSSRLILENNPGEVSFSLGEEIDRIEDFVEQALFYSRSESLEKDYLIRKTTLHQLVGSALKKHAGLLIGAKTAVRAEGLDRTVFTDMKWTDFILGQLIANSVKYRSGPLKISFAGKDRGDSSELTVADNGIGIPEQDLPRVFDKGFTGENGRRGAKSTGMGLYLCKKLCCKMGIGISVFSAPGAGTAVTLVFPKSSMTADLTKV